MVKVKNTTAGSITVVEYIKKTTELAQGEEVEIDPATTLIEIA